MGLPAQAAAGFGPQEMHAYAGQRGGQSGGFAVPPPMFQLPTGAYGLQQPVYAAAYPQQGFLFGGGGGCGR